MQIGKWGFQLVQCIEGEEFCLPDGAWEWCGECNPRAYARPVMKRVPI